MISPAARAEDPAPAAPATPAAPAAPATPAAPALDFGNFSSEAITSKAWESLNAKNFVNAKAYAQKCIDMFGAQAVTMQKGLTAPATVKEQVFTSWALNDVGTCYYILGQALEGEAKGKEAIVPYKFLVDNLAFAQCYDAKGWFWKPAESARERIKALEFDAMK
ncbi:MAG: beta-glucanase precursor [Verrucomicrobiota bacterium]